MPTGPKTALLKGFFKEVLRTLKDDSAYLAQADQLQSASAARGAAAAAAWSVQPDAHRAFARLQQLVVSGDPRAVWAAGKERAKERLREACAAMGRRLEEAGAPAGQQEQQRMEARSAHGVDGGAVVAAAEVDEQQLKHLYGTDGWARAGIMYALAHFGRAWMTQLNTTTVQGAEHLAAALAREPGRPLITVSNHVASIDDPLVVAALLPPEVFASPEKLRWTLCASDRCFHREALVPFFRAAKVLPVERGAGMFQPGLAAAEARLRAGDWVHIFPEGTRSRDGAKIGPARKGVGRLVAACSTGGDGAAAPPRAPLVVPFVHSGMQELMPRGALLPRAGKEVRVLVGEPIEVQDLLTSASREAWPDDELYKRIAARVGLALQSLRARLDGAPLGDGALADLAREQAGASGLDLYDPRDAHANRAGLRGWRAGGAARWVTSVGERLEFKALHRDFAVRGVAAAALERVAGAPVALPWAGDGGPVAGRWAGGGSGGGYVASSGGGCGSGGGGGSSMWSSWASANALHAYPA
ncbi:putative lysophosphatidylcholineacyltransferase [Monoraphidium neglectum]|uniref:Putative lysophosphatidylcholineacyltransferase n=1 Tax=Monoraphidium neglectum TaxID=145388 RepID=A0A0D2JP52_9CHLO|nr:putative lysophosphatidylcholineacyltransferase [Monoraphidium neglectum]KIZ00923.1 putative lysophosphatidylcholineacyltransferase [Monoraphidium neglectum]|eukprot:XP_013899942.1 putative lysophosphatidylcholineacyltransferase [Monoraphidium neglectum]